MDEDTKKTYAYGCSSSATAGLK